MEIKHMLTKPTFSEYTNQKLLQGLEPLKSFNDPSIIRHIEIKGIDLSIFTLPKFDNEGKFIGGPTAFRAEYQTHIQNKLKGISNPCLYVFELLGPDTHLVFEKYKKFVHDQKASETINPRNASSISKNYFSKENEAHVLYIGKSEKPIDGRIIVHFGYYEKGVAGLQLVYWGKEIGLKLNLHVFELLNQKTQNYLEVLEKLLFIQLKPIIGKK